MALIEPLPKDHLAQRRIGQQNPEDDGSAERNKTGHTERHEHFLAGVGVNDGLCRNDKGNV